MPRLALSLFAMAVLQCLLVEVALGQASAASGGAPPPAPQSNSQSNHTAPKRPEAPQETTAMSVGALMQQHGGSMLQAAILATPDPARAKLADVSLFAVPDPTAKTIKKHDLVTIVVHEEGQNTSTGDTSLSKQADFDAKLMDFVQLNLNQMKIKGYSPTVAPELSVQASRDFKGDASVDRADIVTDRITAEVVDVKPNNTLVLQARKRVKTDDEEQEFALTGICRVEDVTADNTVLSSQCFDLAIEKKNKGTVRETTTRGFFPKLLDAINPF